MKRPVLNLIEMYLNVDSAYQKKIFRIRFKIVLVMYERIVELIAHKPENLERIRRGFGGWSVSTDNKRTACLHKLSSGCRFDEADPLLCLGKETAVA